MCGDSLSLSVCLLVLPFFLFIPPPSSPTCLVLLYSLPLCLCVSFLLVHHISLLLPHTLPDMFDIFFFHSSALPPSPSWISPSILLSLSFFEHCTCPVAFSVNTHTILCVCVCVRVCSAILQCSSTVTPGSIRYRSQNASCRKLKVLAFKRAFVCVCVSAFIF